MANSALVSKPRAKAKVKAKSESKANTKSKTKPKTKPKAAGASKTLSSNKSNEPATKKAVVNKSPPVRAKKLQAKSQASNWFLYMIECADGRVYTGITTDVERRFAEHSSSGPKAAKALRGKGPLKLVFKQAMDNRSQASIAESAVKKLSKSDKGLLIASGQLQPFI